MKTIRERFEEIWPAPDGIYWREQVSGYWTDNHSMGCLMDEWNDRLDTFTRCQETTAIHLSLIDELVMDLQTRFDYYSYEENDQQSALLINRAKKLLEQKK